MKHFLAMAVLLPIQCLYAILSHKIPLNAFGHGTLTHKLAGIVKHFSRISPVTQTTGAKGILILKILVLYLRNLFCKKR